MENVKNVCRDCSKEIVLKEDLIENGVYLSYDNNGEKINVFKCKECYAKNPALTNYQPCEVYSRVVGYIRPVQQWHKGKKQEYGEREEFKVSAENCNC